MKMVYIKVTLALCATLLVLGVGIGFIGMPKLMQHMIKKKINLKPGTDTRKVWEQMPFPLTFKVYVFNLTNPIETQNGGKPKLQEIGPFVFYEWKDKFNIEDIEDEDAVSFNMRNTYNFQPDLGLTGEEIITLPHPLIQVMAISIKRDKAPMLKVIAQGIEAIFEPQSAFVSAPFMDIFFRGIDVNCNHTDFAASAVCLNFQTGNVKGAVQIDEHHFKFSLMGASNHSNAGRFKVSRGIKDSRLLGALLAYEENEVLSTWNGTNCNRLLGTDSTIFAPLRQLADDLWAFSSGLCRSMSPKFNHTFAYNKIPAYHYVMDFGDLANESENQCFCKDNRCPAKGTMDLSACTETPMIASQPHFLNADGKLIEAVDGLKPEQSKHAFFIDLEMMTGTMLAVTKRLQYNLDVEPIAEVPVMSQLRPLVMPMFWLEESVALNEVFTDVLQKQIFMPLKINNIFKWLATFIGFFGCLISLYALQERRSKSEIHTTNS